MQKVVGGVNTPPPGLSGCNKHDGITWGESNACGDPGSSTGMLMDATDPTHIDMKKQGVESIPGAAQIRRLHLAAPWVPDDFAI